MADTMQFDLVSPERKLASVQATAVRIPGTEGDLTAMPGHAPVMDACGVAGGTPKSHEGPGVAVFTPNGVAEQGDMGSATLKKAAPVETWKAGTAVEVQWGIRYNHGAWPLPPERLSLPASTVRPEDSSDCAIYRR